MTKKRSRVPTAGTRRDLNSNQSRMAEMELVQTNLLGCTHVASNGAMKTDIEYEIAAGHQDLRHAQSYGKRLRERVGGVPGLRPSG